MHIWLLLGLAVVSNGCEWPDYPLICTGQLYEGSIIDFGSNQQYMATMEITEVSATGFRATMVWNGELPLSVDGSSGDDDQGPGLILMSTDPPMRARGLFLNTDNILTYNAPTDWDPSQYPSIDTDWRIALTLTNTKLAVTVNTQPPPTLAYQPVPISWTGANINSTMELFVLRLTTGTMVQAIGSWLSNTTTSTNWIIPQNLWSRILDEPAKPDALYFIVAVDYNSNRVAYSDTFQVQGVAIVEVQPPVVAKGSRVRFKWISFGQTTSFTVSLQMSNTLGQPVLWVITTYATSTGEFDFPVPSADFLATGEAAVIISGDLALNNAQFPFMVTDAPYRLQMKESGSITVKQGQTQNISFDDNMPANLRAEILRYETVPKSLDLPSIWRSEIVGFTGWGSGDRTWHWHVPEDTPAGPGFLVLRDLDRRTETVLPLIITELTGPRCADLSSNCRQCVTSQIGCAFCVADSTCVRYDNVTQDAGFCKQSLEEAQLRCPVGNDEAGLAMHWRIVIGLAVAATCVGVLTACLIRWYKTHRDTRYSRQVDSNDASSPAATRPARVSASGQQDLQLSQTVKNIGAAAASNDDEPAGNGSASAASSDDSKRQTNKAADDQV